MASSALPDRFAVAPAASSGTPPPLPRHQRGLTSRHSPPTPLAALPPAGDADGADAAAAPPTESTQQRSASASSQEWYGALFGLSQGRRTVSPAVSHDASTTISAHSGAAAARRRTDRSFVLASPRKKPRAANRAEMKRAGAATASGGGGGDGGGCTPEVTARVHEYLRGVDRAGFYTVWKTAEDDGNEGGGGGGGGGGLFRGTQAGPGSPRDRALGDLPELALRRLREEAAAAAGRPGAQPGRRLLMLLPADPAAAATAALPVPSSTHASTAAFYDPGPRPAVHRLAGESRFSQFLGLSRNGRHPPEAARFVRLCGRPAACASRLPSLRDVSPAAAGPRQQLLRSATRAHGRRAGSASLQQHSARPFAALKMHPHPVPRAVHERCSSAAQQTVVVPPGAGGFWRLAVL